jgi:hypothetical protein
MSSKMFFILVAVNIFVLMVVVMYHMLENIKTCKEHYETDTILCSRVHFEHTVMSSPYFKKMSELDLKARNTTSVQQYVFLYVNAWQEFTDEQKAQLQSMVAEIDEVIQPYKNISSIPWKIAKVDVNIENGFPHTLGDMIVLSDNFFKGQRHQMMKTLFHEKVHVFQRNFQYETSVLLNALGYTKCMIPPTLERVKRSNPDLDENIYCMGKQASLQMYDTNTPKSLLHSSSVLYDIEALQITNNELFPLYVPQTEHPFEVMASVLPVLVFDRTGKQKDELLTVVDKWMQKYF